MSPNEPVPTGDPNRLQRALGYGLIILGAIIGGLIVLGGAMEFLNRHWLDVLRESFAGLIGIAIFAVLPIALGKWILRRTGPPPAQAAVLDSGRQPMSAMRLVFAVFGALIMLFAGGCGLLFLGSFIADLDRQGSGANYIGPEVILIFAGPPFLVGLLVWWLAARVGRR